MKHFILANIDNQDKAVKTNNENVKDTYEFFEKPSDEDDFEREIVEDILKDEKKLFEDVQNEPDRRQKIGDAITTADRFIDDDLFSDNDQQDILDFVDKIRSEIDTDDFLLRMNQYIQPPMFKKNLSRGLISQIFCLRRTTRTNVGRQKNQREMPEDGT